MKAIAKAVRKSTGLTMKQFCEDYLETTFHPFAARVNGTNKLHPNEVLLVCLITGQNPLTLFGKDAVEIFLLRGKKEGVNKRIREIISQPDGITKLSLILGNLDGLNFNVQKPEPKPEIQKPKKVKAEKIEKPKEESKKTSDFDFVDTALFSAVKI